MSNVQTDYTFQYLFKQNAKNPSIYDLVNGPTPTQLSYVRLAQPYADYMIKVGAKYVLESYQDGAKYFFTGLIKLIDNWYFGDVKSGNNLYLVLTYIPIDLAAIAVIVLPNKPKSQRRRYLLQQTKKAHYSNVAHLLIELRSNNSLPKIAQ